MKTLEKERDSPSRTRIVNSRDEQNKELMKLKERVEKLEREVAKKDKELR